jgi:hypothetical protein
MIATGPILYQLIFFYFSLLDTEIVMDIVPYQIIYL